MKFVVIGAGIAGLSIGWRLAQSGAQVTVLERAQPGRGATWASAGMIAVAAEAGDDHTPLAQLAHRSAALWPHFAREIEEACAMEVGYRVDGTLLVARTPEEATVMRRRAKGSAALEYLLVEQARALEPLLATDISGALFDPDEAQVDNRAIGLALAVAFQRAGGVLQTNEAVVRLEMENGRVAGARTPFALYRADAFVLAAGAWSGRIEGLPAKTIPPIVPVKGEMIALCGGDAPIPKHMIWGHDIYLVPRGDCVLVGATVAYQGFDSAPTDAAANWLLDHAFALMPALRNWELVEHWAGLRPGSPDNLPLIGPSPLDGLFIASGQFRNGILLAPAIAEAVAGIVLGQPLREDLSAFDPRRFIAGW
jgi:glycine oxidase